MYPANTSKQMRVKGAVKRKTGRKSRAKKINGETGGKRRMARSKR